MVLVFCEWDSFWSLSLVSSPCSLDPETLLTDCVHLAPAVAGFVTGSAFTIATTQIPALIGVQKLFNTRDASYKVIINTLKHLPDAKLDAAFGFTALFALYFIRWILKKLTKRYPQHKRKFFFINVTRNGFVVIVVTLAAWLLTRNDPKGKARITILKDVPRGFRHVGPLRIDTPLVKAIMPHIPVAVCNPLPLIPTKILIT